MEFIKPDWKIEAERRGESLPDWYSLQEVSVITGYTVSYLGRLARKGKILAVKSGGSMFLKEEQIQILLDKK